MKKLITFFIFISAIVYMGCTNGILSSYQIYSNNNTFKYNCPSEGFIIGQYLSNTVSANSSVRGASFSISPALPLGLSINSSTGAISGTAVGVSPSTSYTVTANFGSWQQMTQVTIKADNGFTVNDVSSDAGDSTPGDLICATAGGVCSLRAAIQEINTIGSSYSIIQLPVGQTTLVANATPTTTSVDVYGSCNGTGVSIIDGGGAFQVYRSIGGGSLNSLMIQNGSTSTVHGAGLSVSGANPFNLQSVIIRNNTISGGAFNGAGIFFSSVGVVYVNDSIIQNNTSNSSTGGGGGIAISGAGVFHFNKVIINHNLASGAGGIGGGIYYNSGGTLNLNNVNLSDNTATSGSSGGGGMYVQGIGNINISYSNLSNNTATGGLAKGGAIYFAGTGTTTISNSSFVQNSAYSGGVIATTAAGTINLTQSLIVSNTASSNFSAGGALAINIGNVNIGNSTFVNNQATTTSGNGGAIVVTGGTLVLKNNTFVMNTTAASGNGGAIYRSGGSLSYGNNIFASNLSNGSLNTCGGVFSGSLQNNIFDDSTCYNFGSDQPNKNANLTPLADNGGATYTVKPAPGSPAISAGDWTMCNAAPVNAVDQTGKARGHGGSTCDIGAFETSP